MKVDKITFTLIMTSICLFSLALATVLSIITQINIKIDSLARSQAITEASMSAVQSKLNEWDIYETEK